MSDLLSEQIANQIKEHILSGKYTPGQKLPNEQEWVEQLQVSRSTIREAVKLLESSRVVKIKRGIGTFVEKIPGLIDDPLGLSFLPEEERAISLTEMRLLLEPSVAVLACKRASPEEIEELYKLAEYSTEMYSIMATDKSETALWKAAEADIEFHAGLYRATHNEALARMFPIIRESLTLSFSTRKYSMAQQYFRWENHGMITEAIRRGDEASAAELSRMHVNRSMSYLTKDIPMNLE